MSVVIPAPPLDAAVRSARARIPLKPPRGIWGRLLTWYSRKLYGDVLDSGLAMAHNRKVLLAAMGFERRIGKWDALDPDLKILAQMAAAASIECTWCLDFGYFLAHQKGMDLAKLQAVPNWRASTVFTDRERKVLEYAEAATATPPTVPDELAASLREELGDAAFVELTMMIAVENLRSRFNAALGLASQGFSESCRLPGSRG